MLQIKRDGEREGGRERERESDRVSLPTMIVIVCVCFPVFISVRVYGMGVIKLTVIL